MHSPDTYNVVCAAEDGSPLSFPLNYPTDAETLSATLDAHAGRIRGDVRAILLRVFGNGHAPAQGEMRVQTERGLISILLSKNTGLSIEEQRALAFRTPSGAAASGGFFGPKKGDKMLGFGS